MAKKPVVKKVEDDPRYCVTLVPMNTQLPRQLFYYPVLWQANYA